jgi:hypothetical protein
MSIKKLNPENIATPLAGGTVEKEAKNNSRRDGMMQNKSEPEDVNREAIDEDNDLTKEIEKKSSESNDENEQLGDSSKFMEEQAFYRSSL